MQKRRLIVNSCWVFMFFVSFLNADQYIRFEDFLDRSFPAAIAEIGALPVFTEVSRREIEETFNEFIPGDSLEQMSQTLKKWAPDFFASDYAFPWKGCNYRFGIFNQNETTHKKTRLIQGINCKMSLEFCDWIIENRGGELTPELSRLIKRLTYLDKVCHKIFLEKIEELTRIYPQIKEVFYFYKGKQRLPITLRLIRFDSSERFTMPLHFDISLMSLIFPSNDPLLNECLVIAPADGAFEIEKLKRPLRPVSENQTTALLISGTMMEYFGIPILPTPHGVLPHNQGFRYVIVACLHVPNLDTSKQSFLLPTLYEIPRHLIGSKV